MTRPKKDSQDLRVILDLSFPPGQSVNSHVPRVELDGAAFKLRLPTPMDLANKMRALGKGCLLYKVDLSRAYRQLRSDPLDWPLLGVKWEQQFYVDVAVPFGLRHGASACQRTTEAVVQLAKHDTDCDAEPYIDDTAGAALPPDATDHYNGLLDTMERLGLNAAIKKCQPPSVLMIWIGVLFDSVRMSMAIDPLKIEEALQLCREFMASDLVSLHNMQVFTGKLLYVAKCSEPARKFTTRVLDLLRATQQCSPQPITTGAKLDVSWFLAFLPVYNGITLIKEETAQMVAQVDACPLGAGGICAGWQYYSLDFPPAILQCHFSIASLECYNILIACRLWIQRWSGMHILLYSDNWASVCALNSGVAADPLIRACSREIWLLTAIHDVELTVRHRPGAEMHTADALSRKGLSAAHAGRAKRLVADRKEEACLVPTTLLMPPLPI